MERAPSQLPLALSLPPQHGRDSFIPGPSNKAALTLIDLWPQWPSPVVLLSGPAGSGKTHLAHIWAERAGAAVISASELDVSSLIAGHSSGIVVEDVAADAVPEHALFHLINLARESGRYLVITSRRPAPEWFVRVRDLQSRLRMATPVSLQPPDDDLLRQVLVKLFADRQLMVDKALVDYLLVRMERSLSAARAIVEALDRQTLAAGRSITRAAAAKLLADFKLPAEEFTEPE
jgi:chromosomal replication initiation ATPase DnaA